MLLLFGFLVAGFFYRTVFEHKLPVPSDTLVGLYHPWRDAFGSEYPRGVPFKNFLITDPIRQQIPWKKTVIESWKAGTRPGWNPYAFAGAPLDANIQAAPYYPFNLVFFLFSFPVAWTVFIILQPFLAGTFFYLYVKRLGIVPLAALCGAIVWAFGGFAVSWMTWGTISHTALWLPLVLLGIDMLSQSKKRSAYYLRWSVVSVVATAMTLLGGHIQIAVYALFVSAAYSLWKWKHAPDRSGFRWMLISLGVAGVVTAIQWVPFMRFLMESGRISALDSWKVAGWFLPWQHLTQFIAPDFFGNPATMNYWGVWNYGEFIGYVGVIPTLLAVSAVGMSGTAGFFTAAAAVSLFFMLPHPISQVPYALHIPILSVLQPTRLMVIVDFSLAVLVSYGLDRLLKGDKKRFRQSLGVYGLVLAVLWIVVTVSISYIHDTAVMGNFDVARRNLVLPTVLFAVASLWFVVLSIVKGLRFGRVWTLAIICVVVFDLFRFGWKFTPFTPVSYFFPTTKIIDFLIAQKKPFRVMTLDDRILPPNVSGYYGIETIEGYDPVAPALYEDFLVSGERGRADTSKPTGFNRIYTAHNIDSLLLPYFNVRYVLSLADVKRPYLRFVMKEGETIVYEYTKGLPRVYLADTTAIAQKPADALSRLFDGGLGQLPGIYDGKIPLMNIPLSGDETVDIAGYSPNEIRLKVRTINKRMLVILNRYDSRWSATVDGTITAKVFPVNYLFTGLVVPGGTHDVVVSYH